MTTKDTAATLRDLRTVVVAQTTTAIVTRLTLSMAGEQTCRITTTAADTHAAALQLELPNIVMQFTSAAQVQHMLGFAAFGVQASMDMITSYPLTDPAPMQTAQMRNTVTWLSLPTGTVAREEMPNPMRELARAHHTYPPVHMTKPIPYLVLAFEPVILRVLDTTALRSLIDALRRAHTTAVAIFPDGRQFKADPTRPNWKPRGSGYRRRGHWPTPTDTE